MENIYFQPNKENSEFLAKLEKLDEYTIPQILERMVDHFRNLPELEDALNKLCVKPCICRAFLFIGKPY